MNELNNVDKISSKTKISSLSSKSQVSLEKTEKKEDVQAVNELKKYEIEMEQADHAFALMTEIRQKLETAYKEASSEN